LAELQAKKHSKKKVFKSKCDEFDAVLETKKLVLCKKMKSSILKN